MKLTNNAGLLHFNQFCDFHAVLKSDCMPASHILLVGFISSFKSKVSGKTIKSWLFHCALRSHVTLNHLCALHHNLNLSSPFNAAVWAVASCAFWACCCLGKLTFHILHSTPLCYCLNQGGSHSTKSTKEEGGNMILTAHEDNLFTIVALESHLSINASCPPSLPLFAFMSLNGTSKPILKHLFLSTCHCIWTKEGLDLAKGHSFRIGGLTELLIVDSFPEVVAALGGWSSLAFLLYWHCQQEIISSNIAKAYSCTCFIYLTSALKHFCVQSNIPNAVLLDDM
ncbi:hypothetical protein BDN71DRAFT_1525514 [Pleurotus eryngii]|uniref:Uncharacterized protein n=1 Tax=Pleurotus eryngii TaxID=5323 RepID=A0A9P6DBY6_PLEER|nr:hypothetical protein BDN71DRAFT_1525514 [Pleurotus eryngii]